MHLRAPAGHRRGTVNPHDHVFTVGISIGPLLLRVALLAAIPVVAGFALLRGFLTEPDRATATAVAGVASGAVLLELMLAGGLALPEQAVPLVLVAVAAPLYVIRSGRPGVARLRRLAPWIFGLAGLLAAGTFARAWLGGGAPSTVTTALHTGVVLALVGLAWFIVCGPRTRLVTGIVRGAAALLAVAVIGAAAQATVLRNADDSTAIQEKANGRTVSTLDS